MPLVLRRLRDACILLWLVTILTFALVHLAPGDPTTLLVAPTASPEEVRQLRQAFGLDAPLPAQYASWLWHLLQGDLGISLSRHVPVATVLLEALPVSLLLGGLSFFLSVVGGVGLGVAQGVLLPRWADRLVTIAGTALFALPGFWLALAGITLVTSGAVLLGFPDWMRLPAFGMASPGADPLTTTMLARGSDLMRHAILPVTVLALPGAAGVARFARQVIAESAQAPHVLAAAARGMPRRRLLRRHLLRPAATPLVTLIGLMLPGVLAGSVFVEQVFAWPGLGRTMMLAIAARDVPLVLGLTLVYGAAVIGSNALADAWARELDPRTRGVHP